MGNLLAMLLPVFEKYVVDHAGQIADTMFTEIEHKIESLFKTVNAANPATPAKTIVVQPPKAAA